MPRTIAESGRGSGRRSGMAPVARAGVALTGVAPAGAAGADDARREAPPAAAGGVRPPAPVLDVADVTDATVARLLAACWDSRLSGASAAQAEPRVRNAAIAGDGRVRIWVRRRVSRLGARKLTRFIEMEERDRGPRPSRTLYCAAMRFAVALLALAAAACGGRRGPPPPA